MEKKIEELKKQSLLSSILNESNDEIENSEYQELTDDEKIEEEKFLNEFKKLFI